MKYAEIPYHYGCWINKNGSVIQNKGNGTFQILEPKKMNGEWVIEINNITYQIAHLILDTFIGVTPFDINYKYGENLYDLDSIEYDVDIHDIKPIRNEEDEKTRITSGRVENPLEILIQGERYALIQGFGGYYMNENRAIFDIISKKYIRRKFGKDGKIKVNLRIGCYGNNHRSIDLNDLRPCVRPPMLESF